MRPIYLVMTVIHTNCNIPEVYYLAMQEILTVIFLQNLLFRHAININC